MSDFSDDAKAFTALPSTWHPRRDQPSWDRDFTGRADMISQFKGRTETARAHISEAVAFSQIIMNGMTENERLGMGETARAHIAKESRKNGK